MTGASLRIAGDALCVVLCVAAAATDIRSRRIPNALTLPGLAAGLILAALHGSYDAGAALASVALLGGLFALLAAGGGVGAGDAKLMAAAGALLGWPLSSWALLLHFLVYTTLAGGLLALGTALWKGRLGAALMGIGALARRRRLGDGEGSGLSIPYAVAVAIGAIWTVAGRYWPALLVG